MAETAPPAKSKACDPELIGITKVIQGNIKKTLEKADEARGRGDHKEAYNILDAQLKEEMHGLKKVEDHPFAETFEYALVTSAALEKEKKYKEAGEHIQQTFENILNCTDCEAGGAVMTGDEMGDCPKELDRRDWYQQELKNYKFVFLIWYRGSW